MTDADELPTISSKGITGTLSADGQVKIPIIPTSQTYGRVLREDGDPPVIQPVAVKDLQAGDILYLALPLLAYNVIDNTFKRNLGEPTSRNILTLVDVTGEKRKYSFSPTREFHRVSKGTLGLAPWAGMPLEVVSDAAKEDALWTKIVDPAIRPFRYVVHAAIDLQCYLQSLTIHSGLLGVAVALIVFAAIQRSEIPTTVGVAMSIVGAFLAERSWESWKQHIRRRLAAGFTTRVRFHPFGGEDWAYATLRVKPHGAVLVGSEADSPNRSGAWFTTRIELSHRKKLLATCTFANDARQDDFRSCRDIADAVRHRIEDGSTRTIYCRSVKSDPAKDSLGDIVIHPRKNVREFDMSIADDESRKQFNMRLKRYQMRMLADALEVMDQGRRL